MDNADLLAVQFDRQRPRLRGLAYRLLGSRAAAEDAVQEAWLRWQRQTEPIDSLEGWLTTTVARISLNVLRSRRQHPEDSLDGGALDLMVTDVDNDPEQQALLADAVSAALLVVLNALTPSERVAFVLHDVFVVPFPEVAALLSTTPAAARQLASRARRRVQETPRPDRDLQAQRHVVDAFFAAAREGRVADLAAILHGEVVLRVDGRQVAVGPAAISRQAALFAADADRQVRPALVNGSAGVVVVLRGQPLSVMAFLVVAGRVAAIDAVSDPDRLVQLDLGWLDRS